MGYTKIVQYANIVEVYEYEKELKIKPPNHVKHTRLASSLSGSSSSSPKSLFPKKKKQLTRHYRSDRSNKRTLDNFFRLCHHNVYTASTVHFLTLTFAYDLDFSLANRLLSRFISKLRKYDNSFSYIAVPELTKKNRWHYHLLVFNLSPQLSGETKWYDTRKGRKYYTTERETRNLQVQFLHGYVDIVPASYTSTGVAGYMAKYMAKSLTDERYASRRGYSSSNNIEKVSSAGGNSLSGFLDLVVPTEDLISCEVSEYDVKFMGNCKKTKIRKIK
jgi:hypothetical protein